MQKRLEGTTTIVPVPLQIMVRAAGHELDTHKYCSGRRENNRREGVPVVDQK